MFAHFVNTFTQRLHIAQVTKLDLTQAFDKKQPGQSILQAFEPVGKLFETFYLAGHARYLGALKLPLVNSRLGKSCEKCRFPGTPAMCLK